MTTTQKQAIVNEIRLLSEKESQSKVAKKADVSTATISQMLNHNWDLIKDEMWQRVKINLRIELEWQTAETTNFRELTKLLKATQQTSMSVCIVNNAGTGKSHAYESYERKNENVIYIRCKKYWTSKTYVKNLCIACGLDSNGNKEDLIERFTRYIKGLYRPLIIIDQFDKLNETSMDLFMDLYDDFFFQCGFLLSGVPALKKRIERGCQLDKTGYREARSRFGSYTPLFQIKESDVKAICVANGVTDEQFINETYNICDGDFRRVRKNVEKYFLMQNN